VQWQLNATMPGMLPSHLGNDIFGVGPDNQLTEFINDQYSKREAERWAPEHSGDRCSGEDILKPRPVLIDNGNHSRTNHPNGYNQVLPWSPERIRLQE